MDLTPQHLFNMAKQTDGTEQQVEPEPTTGKKILNGVKSVGMGIAGAAGGLAQAVQTLGTPGDLKKISQHHGYGCCPTCNTDDAVGTHRERRPNGYTTCGACGYKAKSSLWTT